MSSYIVPYVFVPNTLIQSAQVNSNFSTAASVINGNLDTTNLKATAGIVSGQLALTAPLLNLNATTAILGFGVGQTGDTKPRVGLYSDGSIQFGAGTATTPDVELIRSAANTLELAVPGGGTPTFNFNGATLTGLTTITVPNGGTGAVTLTAHGVVIGEGTSAVNITAAGAVNTALTGNGASADPTFQLLSYAYPQLRVYGVTATPYGDTTSSGSNDLYCGPLSAGSMVTWDNGSGVLTTTALTETTLALTMTSGNAYSIFLYNNSGSWTLEADVWSGINTPITYGKDALGRLAKSGSTTKLLVAEAYAGGTNTVYDYPGMRGICNVYNEKPRAIQSNINTATWTNASATIRASDANTTYAQGRVGIFVGSASVGAVNCTFTQPTSGPAGITGWAIGIGVDSTTAYSSGAVAVSETASGGLLTNTATLCADALTVGFHYIQSLEQGGYNQTTTFVGNSTNAGGTGLTGTQGLQGTVWQ